MPKAAQDLPDAAALASESGVDLEVCQCAGCGLVQLSSDPVPYYREVIRAAAVSDVIRRSKTKQFAGFIEAHALRGKRILEVGCGRGEFLSLVNINLGYHRLVAYLGGKLMLDGVWKGTGVYNVEQLDPDPFMKQIGHWGLPWQETFLDDAFLKKNQLD